MDNKESKKIILNDVALNGVKNAELVTDLPSPEYLALAEESNERILKQQREDVKVYQKAKRYIVKW